MRVSWSAMAMALGATSLAHAAQTAALFDWAAGSSGASTSSATLTDGSTTITANLSTEPYANSGLGFSSLYSSLSWFPAGLTLNGDGSGTRNSVTLGYLGAGSLQTISFSGGTVTDPILFLNYGDPGLVVNFTGWFQPSLTFTTLGSGSHVTQAGTQFTFSGSATNDFVDGFAVQLTGTFSTIQFELSGFSDSVSIGLAAPLAPVAVPGSGLAAVGSLGLAGLARRRRR